MKIKRQSPLPLESKDNSLDFNSFNFVFYFIPETEFLMQRYDESVEYVAF